MIKLSKELYPFNGKFIKRSGLRYHYLDEGKGDPIVMVHGNPTWSFYYRCLVSELCDTYRCIVPDHMGCGLSDKPGDDRYEYTLKSRVDDLEALIEYLDLGRGITLVLHDWGGMIGMAYAVRVPQHIKRIVLFNTSAFHLPGHMKFPWQLRLVRNSRLGGFMVRGLNAFSRTAAFVCCKKKPLTKKLRDAYCAPYDTWSNRIATLRFVQDIPIQPGDRCYQIVSEVQAKLRSFQDRPVMICWGEKDFVFNNQVLDVWLQYLPRAEVHRFSDCGHYVLEDAADEISPLVRRFLENHPLS